MPKKIFAVTNVKVNSDFFAAGTVIDRSKFSDDQLVELHKEGAIEVRTVDDPAEPDPIVTDVDVQAPETKSEDEDPSN